MALIGRQQMEAIENNPQVQYQPAPLPYQIQIPRGLVAAPPRGITLADDIDLRAFLRVQLARRDIDSVSRKHINTLLQNLGDQTFRISRDLTRDLNTFLRLSTEVPFEMIARMYYYEIGENKGWLDPQSGYYFIIS